MSVVYEIRKALQLVLVRFFKQFSGENIGGIVFNAFLIEKRL